MTDMIGCSLAPDKTQASANLEVPSSKMSADAHKTARATHEFCSKIFMGSVLATMFCLAGTFFGFTAVVMFLLNNPLAVKVAMASAGCIASSILMQAVVNCCIARRARKYAQI